MADAPKHRPWTIMVYMAGDNGKIFASKYGQLQLMATMTDQGYSDLLKMGAVGTTDNAAVVCLFDTTQGSYLIEVRKGQGFADSQVTQIPEVNTGDPNTLAHFITQSVQNYPADHYLLVIWNHGSGWLDVDAYSVVRSVQAAKRYGPIFRTTPRKLAGPEGTRPIAYDDASMDFLDTSDLREAFTDAATVTGVRLDLIGMDACLMAMIEGDRELAPFFDYFVASQEVEPMNGWPYGQILTALNALPQTGPAELARLIVEEYAKSYGGHTRTEETATQAAVVLGRTAQTEGLCKTLVDCVLANQFPTLRRLVQAAVGKALSFEDHGYRDLGDFAAQLAKATVSSDYQDVAKAAQALADHLQGRGPDAPVMSVGFVDSYVRASGMSVYLPDSLPATGREQTLSIYRELSFPQSTGWDKLIEWQLGD
jgi:hypothetical protein